MKTDIDIVHTNHLSREGDEGWSGCHFSSQIREGSMISVEDLKRENSPESRIRSQETLGIQSASSESVPWG